MFQLDEFLRVYREVELPTGEKVILRVLSDLEMNARHDYALGEALKVSENLKNTESDLYQSKVAPLHDSTVESLIGLMSTGRMYELEREARELFKTDFVPAPDDPTLGEEIDSEQKQSDHETKVAESRAKYIIDGLAIYRQKVSELPRETILKELHARAVQAYSYTTSQDAEVYYTIWCATENPDKTKRWKSVDYVRQMPMKIIDHLYTLYKELDSINPWELTKSESQGTPDRVG